MSPALTGKVSSALSVPVGQVKLEPELTTSYNEIINLSEEKSLQDKQKGPKSAKVISPGLVVVIVVAVVVAVVVVAVVVVSVVIMVVAVVAVVIV